MPHLPAHSAGLAVLRKAKSGTDLFSPEGRLRLPAALRIEDGREGLLHDARNLMGALGLYCDLLAVPGVLKPEHRHYADEVRLLGSRSGALIEHLMEREISLLEETVEDGVLPGAASLAGVGCRAQVGAAQVGAAQVGAARDGAVRDGWDGDAEAGTESEVKPVSLRSVVERCSGLLSQMAGGRTIEVNFGPAAAVPVRVAEEAIERVLVNLVRNAAAALVGWRPPSCLPAKDLTGRQVCGGEGRAMGRAAGRLAAGSSVSVRDISADGLADVSPGTIRIGVGLLANRVGEARPWPFRRVRLAVEDSGCGMTPQHLEWLLHGVRAPGRGNHGIGFRVVRELVAASDGELRVMSAPGTGTRVQIEWPMAAVASLEGGHVAGETAKAPDLRGHVQPVARKPVARKPVAWESLARESLARDKSPLRVSRAGDVSGFAEGQGA
jgi:signal transduction histidine kinase